VILSAWDAGSPSWFWMPATPRFFYRCNEPKQQKLRLHLDLRPVDRDHSAELSRLLDAGAVPTDIGQGETGWAVLADPEGNEFCLLHPLASS
jgi:glyoxalase superfamily protein